MAAKSATENGRHQPLGNTDMTKAQSEQHLSLLGAWALAFGCAVGWDAFALAWTSFLPKAGPIGTILGLLVGGLIMVVVAWNYHYMINRHPGPGGVYYYAADAFGSDHGFLCAWFLCLTYAAIVWADATAMVIVARYLLGDLFRFGFHYRVADNEVYLGYILLSVSAIAIASVICCRRTVARSLQTVLALACAVGIVACFIAASGVHVGGAQTLAPAFSPTGGGRLSQILGIVIISPWLFIGFETISNTSGEFQFPIRKSFGVMAAALVTAIFAYVLLMGIPVLAPGAGFANWVEGLSRSGDVNFVALDVAKAPLGRTGAFVLGFTLIGALFTNLIGNTVAASRLLAAMADDGVLPVWFGRKTREGSPRNAVIAIACVSLVISALGQTVIGIIVEVSIVGAAIAYAYTSAATLKTAHKSGNRLSTATGLAGLVFSVMIILLFIVPNLSADVTGVETESYLVLVIWCIAGLITFLSVFHNDRSNRFGQSPVVWISLLAVILFLSFIWIRQTTYDTTTRAFDDLVEEDADSYATETADTWDARTWSEKIHDRKGFVNHSIMRNYLVQTGLTVLSLALMFILYKILRHRERELEREKAKAKSYFFSTVSHDIRTPLNAIIGFTEMLQQGFKTEEERAQALDAILVSGRSLLGLINDVLDLSKLESGKMKITPEPTDCPRLMCGLMDAFRASSSTPGLELRCRAEAMPPLMLDPQRLRQIVFNLVGNAVKFTATGYVELRVSYERAENAETGLFRLEVEDTGCGISEEDQKHIGNAYVQVGAKQSRNGGTGLGLAICHQLAVAMGGRLGVVSKLGRGSTFSIEIPDVRSAPKAGAAIAAPAADEGRRSKVEGPGESGIVPAATPKLSTLNSQLSPRPIGTKRRILVVDDAKLNAMVLKALLKNLGDFDITVAMDGQEALTAMTAPGSVPFDLVLTDMWMPNLDGEGLVRAIRKDPALAPIRVIVVTADVEMRTKAVDMGFDDILLKPVTSERLARALAGEVDALAD